MYVYLGTYKLLLSANTTMGHMFDNTAATSITLYYERECINFRNDPGERPIFIYFFSLYIFPPARSAGYSGAAVVGWASVSSARRTRTHDAKIWREIYCRV